MLKVLVADENLVASQNCCQYLANDKSLDVVSSNTGSNTLKTYYKINPNILVINSDFKDKSYTDIVNELSSTSEGRNECNIILTLGTNAQPKFNSMSKVYQIFYLSLEDKCKYANQNIHETIQQFKLDRNIFYEFNNKNLTGIFYKLQVKNHSNGARYLKYAIQKCYENPELRSSLNNIFQIVSLKFGISPDSVRSAMRIALIPCVEYKEKNGNIGLFKIFENDAITLKNFINIISTKFLENKK